MVMTSLCYTTVEMKSNYILDTKKRDRGKEIPITEALEEWETEEGSW